MHEKKHHQKSQNFQVANRVIRHNQEIQIRSKEKQTITPLILTWQRFLQVLWMKILAQIMLYIPDLKSGLTINTFPSSKKFFNGQTHQKECSRELQTGCDV
jgi:hypothetical protein